MCCKLWSCVRRVWGKIQYFKMKKIILFITVSYLIFIFLVAIYIIEHFISIYKNELVEGYGQAIIVLGFFLINSVYILFFKRKTDLKINMPLIYVFQIMLLLGVIFSSTYLWLIVAIILIIMILYFSILAIRR